MHGQELVCEVKAVQWPNSSKHLARCVVYTSVSAYNDCIDFHEQGAYITLHINVTAAKCSLWLAIASSLILDQMISESVALLGFLLSMDVVLLQARISGKVFHPCMPSMHSKQHNVTIASAYICMFWHHDESATSCYNLLDRSVL